MGVSTIGERIADIRREKGFSQRIFAKMLNMQQPNISKIETGGTNPPLDTLEQVLFTLGAKIVIQETFPGLDKSR